MLKRKKHLLLIIPALVFPFIVRASLLDPTGTITLNVGTTTDGVFNFDILHTDTTPPFDENYSITTSGGVGTVNIELPVGRYNLDPLVQGGYSLGGWFCFKAGQSDASYSYDPTLADTNVAIGLGDNGHVTCSYGFTKSSRTPILIVPGLLGTEIKKGNDLLWANPKMALGLDTFMDPLQFGNDLKPIDNSLAIQEVLKKIILDTGAAKVQIFDYTESLINDLAKQGYSEDKDLFTFPYDWRYGVSGQITPTTTVVDLLKAKIDSIRAETGSDVVDVVAHSTGGLLVKRYVMENPTTNHVRKAIFVGVPNLGAPKAVKVLMQGDNFGINGLSDSEMQKIAQNIPVTYDLSPSERYFDLKGSYIKVVDETQLPFQTLNLNFSNANNFLINEHQANAQGIANAQSLHTETFDNYDMRTAGVDLYAIDGCKTGTIGKIVEKKNINALGQTSISYAQPEMVPGDGTVPLESATNLPIDQNKKYYALSGTHAKMLSQNGIRQEIVNLLAGSNLDTGTILTQDIAKCKLKGKAMSIYSPLSIEVIDQDGNRSGLAPDGSIQNDIPGADYEIMGEHKFVFVPTDTGQTYTINLVGTGTGTFTFKDETIDDDQVAETEVFSNIPVTPDLTGFVNLGDVTTLSLQVTPTSSPVVLQPSSVVDSHASQDVASPVSTPTLTGTVGKPGFYRSDVTISLAASDPVVDGDSSQTSGVLDTKYNVDNAGYQTYDSSFVVSGEGQHTLKFFSTDKAGNNEPEQAVTFTIDKTAPEFNIQFSPDLKDLVFSGTDNVSAGSAVNVFDNDDTITLTDEAGNQTILALTTKGRKSKLSAELKSLAYNGQAADIGKAALKFSWVYDKSNQLAFLDQYVNSKKDFSVEAMYKPNQTTLLSKDLIQKTSQTLNGLLILKVSTNKGDLDWAY